MKRFIYSNYTKFIAVVLFIVSVVSGALIAVNGISDFLREDEIVYRFESDFSESEYFSFLLSEPENVVFNAFQSTYGNYGDNDSDADSAFDAGYDGENTENETVSVTVGKPFDKDDGFASLYVADEGMNDASVDVTYFTQDGDETLPNEKTSGDDVIRIIKITDPAESNHFDIGYNGLIAIGTKIDLNINRRLEDMYANDKINYYINLNGKIFTNCGLKNPEDFMQEDFYSYIKRDAYGSVMRMAKPQNGVYSSYLTEELYKFDETSTIVICSSIKQDYVNKVKVLWERQESIVIGTFTKAFVAGVIAVLLLIYLICVCGKSKDGKQKTMWLDNIWAEVHFAVMFLFGAVAFVLFVSVINRYAMGHFPHNLTNAVLGAALALVSIVAITSLLSIVRNIKCKRFVETSIIIRIIRWCWRVFVKIVKWIYGKAKEFKSIIFKVLSQKTGIILISMLFVYTALIGIFGVFTIISPIWLAFGVMLFGFASFIAAYRAKDLDEIKKGVSEVRGGNVAYKIPELKSEDMKVLAANINDIAKGLDESVSAKIKAERLKTELITNVSHDLKTPITSIISYTELLSKIEELPEEAKDYVSVISKKSERLKNLTQDLFDISKVQSGNEDVFREKIDVALLINQSLGEHDNEIQKSELPFCVDVPKELYISADGRKMSRVVSNLINNILKYTLKNTRVFITAFEKDGEVVMEFKNIASYPMNFSADEIAGRFVRGDESRTKEGNGLGLAIAKSYTELCGGVFEIVTDGDMFKAIIKFKKH